MIRLAITNFSQLSTVLIATDTSRVTKTMVDITAKLTQSLLTMDTVTMEHNNMLWLHKVLIFLSTELTEQAEASALAQELIGTTKFK